uniref:Precorrin-8X methylmutase n=1 Tax=Candidatus Kentrum sp. FW TaxID=2126338 RepID=A0A450TQM0_9GAMM|nr:MAG: precorrin-8X methylmutase [Candidatus Kentron sp. FW]
MSVSVTEQLTSAGWWIEHDSFAIIDQEAGAHTYGEDQWPIVRHMIHATADFEFNGLTHFHSEALTAGIRAIQVGAPIVSDVGMIRAGLSKTRLLHFGIQAHQFIDDEDVIASAHEKNTTHAIQAIDKAHGQGLMDNGIIAIGNAPTALLEAIRLIGAENARPALAIGMPVGFVSAAESKAELAKVSDVPWILTEGRKSGSTLVVAVVHALLGLADMERSGI